MSLKISRRTRRILLWGLGFLVLLFAIAGFVSYSESVPQDPFLARVYDARQAGLRWLIGNVRDNGLFVYSFNPETGETPDTNNAIRQLMASRILAEESREHWLLRGLHRRNLGFLMKNWYTTDEDRAYVFYDNKSKLGANAMLLRTLAASPYFDDYRGEATALAQGILHLQHADGSFEPWYVEPDYEYDTDYLLTFYSGEALLALVEYYEKLLTDPFLEIAELTAEASYEHHGKYLEAAEKSANFYLNRYVTRLSENYYPAYVPWHTLAYNKLYKLTGDQKYADAIFVLNDKLLELQDTTGFVGRFYNPATPQYGSPHSSSDAVYTEGLAYAYEVARLAGDSERAARYREAIELGVENLISLQYQEPVPGGRSVKRTYLGALRVNVQSPWIRVDTTQHAVDAFTKILEVFGEREVLR
ncbi:hypothetical protein L0Y40_03095 [Candidatus Wolfebacteria bacterium]|nr:hypothetical protein [Candidatus Wolfebacteria bacterium]